MLFYSLQKFILTKVDFFFSKIYYHTSLQDHILSGASVVPSSQVLLFIILLSVIAGNLKVQG